MVQGTFGSTQEIVDVVVVGAGAAGLSAALFLSRARRRTIVYDGGPTRASVIKQVHEFLGYEGITPAELQARGCAEVVRYGGEIRSEAVLKIEPRPDGLFDVWSRQGMVTARAVVLATGLVDVLPSVPGLREGWGRDVHVCPCFSGYEVRDKHLIAFGLGERLAQLGSFLTAWSSSVTVVTTHEFDSAALDRLHELGVEIVRDEVTALVRQDDRLVSVSTAGGTEAPTDAVFVAAPFRAASDLPASLCEVNEAGFAVTDADGQTSRPGVWVIGNATDPVGHLAHATAAGARVGPWVVNYLLELSRSWKTA
ncbi:MAG TPA: NAD(P)/FAD-dependent oxidoreductase [Ktedonobacteraceae bacterium]|nr:NAD(P)/FAD-dependent oxidoreductase [Ktedonobacteraceae bacterium]